VHISKSNLNFFQIFLSDSIEPLPPLLVKIRQTAIDLFPNHNHFLFDSISLHTFLIETADPEIIQAYELLIPFAYKADLARYFLIYKFGGWYADITLKFISAITLTDQLDILYFYDFGDGLPSPFRVAHDCMNAFFFASAGSPILSNAIEMVLRNCHERNYGFSSLCPTGPTLFGRAIAMNAPRKNQLFGHFMPLTPFHPNKNKSFVAPDGSIIARHKSAWHSHNPGPGDLSPFGVKGSNSYFELWRSRKIYAN
jgi:hypothetical protein